MYKLARTIASIVLLIGLIPAGLLAEGEEQKADPQAGEEINWQVISSGGTEGVSTNYNLAGTVAQTAVGTGTSDNYGINHGFWQDFVTGGEGCCGIYTGGLTGNANCSEDGKLTLSDISRLIDHLYISKTDLCCYATGNTNGSVDCKITLSDISRLIDALYISKLPTEACMASCEQ